MLLCLVIFTGCDQIESASRKPYEPVNPNSDLVNGTQLNTSMTEDIDWEKYDLLKPHIGNLTFYFLDLPGTPILVTFPYNSTIVINSGDGTDSSRIYNYVRNLGYRDVDYIFLSNYNSYRIGGAASVIRKGDINISYDRGGATNTKYFNEYISSVSNRKPIGVTTELEIDGVDITITPAREYLAPSSDEDFNTLLFQFDYGDFSFLHAGDCIDECEDIFDDKDFDADVLVAGKNGDCLGTTTFVLNRLNPKLIVFDNSVGEVCEDVEIRVKYLDINYKKLIPDKKFFITTDGTLY